MNSVQVIGNLVRDPDVRFTKTGKTVTSMTVAVSRDYHAEGKEPLTDFIPVVIWGSLAEACGDNLHKGNRVYVHGRLQVRSYEKDGIKRYVTEIVADFVSSSITNGSKPALQPESKPAVWDDMGKEVSKDLDQDNIPF